MLNIIKYMRWLSLDIVLGGAIFLFFIGDQLQVTIPLPVLSAFGICIWLIYTLDHQRDIALGHLLGDRRVFHWAHRRLIRTGVGLLGLIGVFILFLLPKILLIWGSMIALICGVYLLTARWLAKIMIKEVMVAMLYACGIFLYPVTQVKQFDGMHLIFALQLMFLAFANIVLISRFELKEDRRNGVGSMVQSMGMKVSGQLIFIILSFLLSSALIIGLNDPLFFELEIVYFVASTQLMLIYGFPHWFLARERYRAYADAIFFYPLVFLL